MSNERPPTSEGSSLRGAACSTSTAVQVAERANVSRDTLRRLKSTATPQCPSRRFSGVARALGALDRVVDALDPFQTEDPVGLAPRLHFRSGCGIMAHPIPVAALSDISGG